MERRDFLKTLAAAPVAAMLPTTPARDLMAPVFAHLRFVVRRGDPRAASEAAGFAGWLAWDQGDHQAARRYYRRAVTAARSSGSDLLTAYMLGSMAVWAAEVGNAHDAAILAGEVTATTTTNPTARAWIGAVEATAYAANRQAEDAFAALAGIRPGGEPSWPWLTPFTDAKLSGAGGHVATMLGRPRTAVPALLDALDPAPTKARARTRADLATCYRALGDSDRADQAAREARVLATAAGTRRL